VTGQLPSKVSTYCAAAGATATGATDDSAIGPGGAFWPLLLPCTEWSLFGMPEVALMAALDRTPAWAALKPRWLRDSIANFMAVECRF
jgi:hypothetical protein